MFAKKKVLLICNIDLFSYNFFFNSFNQKKKLAIPEI